MGFFVKAAVHALKKYPVVNASIDGTDIVYHGYFDIGIAVGSPRGLVVPILRDADQMSLADIEKQIADFGKRAQDGKLTIEELTGGTYTITQRRRVRLDAVDADHQSAAVGDPRRACDAGPRRWSRTGRSSIRPINYLALSYDHRIIDGREAVLSLVAIKEALEDPARLLLDYDKPVGCAANFHRSSPWLSNSIVVVIGGGPGGYTAAIRAAQLGLHDGVHRRLVARGRQARAGRHVHERRLHPVRRRCCNRRRTSSTPGTRSPTTASTSKGLAIDVAKMLARKDEESSRRTTTASCTCSRRTRSRSSTAAGAFAGKDGDAWKDRTSTAAGAAANSSPST